MNHTLTTEQRVALCKAAVVRIRTMLRESPGDWRDYVNLAHMVTQHLETIPLAQVGPLNEQTWMIASLQQLALLSMSDSTLAGVAMWCSRAWLGILVREQENLAALHGVGRLWLARAQPALTRVHRIDGSNSSSGSSSRPSVVSFTSSEDERQSLQATREAEARVGMPDYIEARGFLQPATEYLERAVASARSQNLLSGDLLSVTAESYMSLGNVSSPRVNEDYYRRAVRLLRAATLLPDYTLSRYLSGYLEEYGRLTVSNIRALTASLFGVAAGTLGLESYPGFLFYFIGTAVVSVLIFALKADSSPKAYFFRPVGDLWVGDLFGGLMSFVLTWTLFYGLCKA
ncbi:hypothetical protein B0A48_13867 [Cryoendolithus antarcticus]|uniref:ER membrane protein complex subunit 6 n=1 Tax=Cryoendolithus antarcticus TaxID=1507870 RepID=A0A1V8SMW8_9PEZI|nr:hypothetical protein B0A48_13867 [Cryoendolithus antarcticus]